MARTKVRTAVSTPKSRRAKLPRFHAHGCVKCKQRYTDTDCADPYVNGSCISCRTGHPVSTLRAGMLPVGCCIERSVRVTDVDTLSQYALGGPGPWYQCQVCKRTHPFDPSQGVPA